MSRSALRDHRRIVVDTSVWIHHLNGSADYARPAGLVLSIIESGRAVGIVSELTILDVLARPLQLQCQDAADLQELLLYHFPNLEIVPVTRDVLIEAAVLRARHRLRTQDGIILATGLSNGATAAATIDSAWTAVDALEVVLLRDL